MTKYNGYTNRETYIVSLWLNNDSSLYENAKAIVDNHKGLSADLALRDYVTAYVDEDIEAPSLADDLIGYALDGVIWKEVTESLNS